MNFIKQHWGAALFSFGVLVVCVSLLFAPNGVKVGVVVGVVAMFAGWVKGPWLKATLSILALAVVVPAASSNTVCVADVCREVDTSPVAREFAQDVNEHPPKYPARHRLFDKKLVAAIVVDVGVSVATTLTLNRCREDHGVGACVNGGYGPYAARETVRQAQTAGIDVGTIFFKRLEDRRGGRKFWWAFPAFNTVWNATIIARNSARTYGPKEVE